MKDVFEITVSGSDGIEIPIEFPIFSTEEIDRAFNIPADMLKCENRNLAQARTDEMQFKATTRIR